MAISGLVLSLSQTPDAAASAVAAVSCDPRITVGERFGRRLAIVIETPTCQQDLDLLDHLRSTPGVDNIDVTFVGIDEATTQEAAIPQTSPRIPAAPTGCGPNSEFNHGHD